MCFDKCLFKNSVSNNLICSVCSLVLCIDSVEDKHGHKFCSNCIKTYISKTPLCPVDKRILTKEMLKPVSVQLVNLLKSQEVICENECEKKVTLESLKTHKKLCGLKNEADDRARWPAKDDGARELRQSNADMKKELERNREFMDEVLKLVKEMRTHFEDLKKNQVSQFGFNNFPPQQVIGISQPSNFGSAQSNPFSSNNIGMSSGFGRFGDTSVGTFGSGFGTSAFGNTGITTGGFGSSSAFNSSPFNTCMTNLTAPQSFQQQQQIQYQMQQQQQQQQRQQQQQQGFSFGGFSNNNNNFLSEPPQPGLKADEIVLNDTIFGDFCTAGRFDMPGPATTVEAKNKSTTFSFANTNQQLRHQPQQQQQQQQQKQEPQEIIKCITSNKEHENKSREEIRNEYYKFGHKYKAPENSPCPQETSLIKGTGNGVGFGGFNSPTATVLVTRTFCAPPAPPPPINGLFGPPSTTTPATNPFAAQNQTGGLFGAPKQASGLFGVPPPPPPQTNNLFGGFNSPTATVPVTRTFCAPPAPPPPINGLFGPPSTTTPATNPFAAQNQTGGLFGAPVWPSPNSGLFGAATNNNSIAKPAETTHKSTFNFGTVKSTTSLTQLNP